MTSSKRSSGKASPDTSQHPSSPWILIGDEIPNDADLEIQLLSSSERDFESQASFTHLMQGMEITKEQATFPIAADTLTGEGQRREILKQLQAYLENEKTQEIREHFITMVSGLIAPKGQSGSASGAVLRMGASMIPGDDLGDRPGDEKGGQLTHSGFLQENEQSGELHTTGGRALVGAYGLILIPAATSMKEDQPAKATPSPRRHDEGVKMIKLRLRPLESEEHPSAEQGWMVRGRDTVDLTSVIGGSRSSGSGRKQKRRRMKLRLTFRTLDDSELLLGNAGEDGHHEGGTDGVGDPQIA